MSVDSQSSHAPHGTPFELRARPSAIRSPLRYAMALAGAYVVFGTIYIVVSTWLAASNALSVEQMERVETWKGIAYIAVTAGLLFAFSLALFRRIRRQEELITRQYQAIHNSERAILAGTFAGTIAHDINNALTASTLAVEELRSAVKPGSEEAALASAVDQSLRSITEWNRRLFDLGSRRAGGNKSKIDLAALVANCVELARHHMHLRGREIRIAPCARGATIHASEPLVRRAVLNLLLNAAEACGDGGRIDVAVQVEAPGAVRIQVDDSGPGVPEALRAKILEPFFTTKTDGTGIGLASVVACADFHEGSVRIGEAPLGGARFELALKG
jgi:two-component system sensor histidine kinase HydH